MDSDALHARLRPTFAQDAFKLETREHIAGFGRAVGGGRVGRGHRDEMLTFDANTLDSKPPVTVQLWERKSVHMSGAIGHAGPKWPIVVGMN